MVSIKDISNACGVSVATVSKALNNHSDISEETKKKVSRVAQELGYIPNFASKALKTNRTYNIGVLYDNKQKSGLIHGYFTEVLDGFKNAAESKGYDITFINNKSIVAGRKMSFLEHSKYRGFDGVVILCYDFNSEEIEELVKSEVPLVTVDYVFDGRSAVMSDNIKGISDIIKYVYKMGHRKIAYVHGDKSAVTNNRLASFYKTCQELGIEVRDEYIKEATYRDTTEAYIATDELINLPDPPTCILFPDDFASIGGMNCIRKFGYNIPDDYSVVGYDGNEISQYLAPPLTTMVQDKIGIGASAAEKLISLIENPKATLVEQIKIQGVLFEGGSVKDIN